MGPKGYHVDHCLLGPRQTPMTGEGPQIATCRATSDSGIEKLLETADAKVAYDLFVGWWVMGVVWWAVNNE